MLLFTKSVNRMACITLGALLAAGGMSAAVQAQGRRAECSEYARGAVSQYEESQRLHCDFEGPRWSDAREAHFAWCLISPHATNDESRLRRAMLRGCSDRGRDRRAGENRGSTATDGANQNGRRANCETYAKLAMVLAEANEKYGCGLTGHEWTRDDRSHFHWCMTDRREFGAGRLGHRADALNKCFKRLGDYDEDTGGRRRN